MMLGTALILAMVAPALVLSLPATTMPSELNATVLPPSLDPQCYLMPILVLHPSSPLPTLDCVQPPLPSEDCIKATVSATLRVLQHPTDEWTCLHDATRATTIANMTSLRVQYRGDSSLRFAKHQHLLMFDAPTPLLSMPADTDWSLHGPFIDGSLMRNHLAHWLYRNTGRYSPRSQHVALYIVNPKGVPVYAGYYLLLETIGYGPNRVGLAPNTAASLDHSGGWAWQYNPLKFGTYSPNVVFDMYHGKFGMGARPLLMYPPGPSLSQRMRDEFVDVSTGFLPQYHRYLWHNMTAPLGLKHHIDVGSYVDYFLHTEWSLNQDAYTKSAYFFKDRQRPMEAGPVWDLNLAYGLGSHAHADAWLYLAQPAWMRLVCNFEFANLAIARWKALRTGVWSDATVVTFVQATAAPLQRNLEKCKDWTSNKPSCASVSGSNQGTFVDQVSLLQAILIERAHWMDNHVEGLFQKLDGDICGSVGDLPAFNCAEDGDDGGCLTAPADYYSKVVFPPIRPPRSQEKTPRSESMALGDASAYDMPSIDPCWLSMGTSVTAGYITLTCSGYGFCPMGPNATCVCNNHATSFDCKGGDEKAVGASTRPWTISRWDAALLSACGVFALVALLSAWRRYRRSRQGEPLLGGVTVRNYGASSGRF